METESLCDFEQKLEQNLECCSVVKSKNIPPLLDYTRVDCDRPRMYPGGDPELYLRGRLRWLPESTPSFLDLPPPPLLWLCEVYSAPRITPIFNNYMRPAKNLPLPPKIYPSFQQLYATLPESTPPSQNPPPPLSTNKCDPPESTPLSQTKPSFSTTICDPPRIYPPFQQLYTTLPESTPPPPRIYPLFQQLYGFATLPESTPPSQNIIPFSTTILLGDPPRIYPSLP